MMQTPQEQYISELERQLARWMNIPVDDPYFVHLKRESLNCPYCYGHGYKIETIEKKHPCEKCQATGLITNVTCRQGSE